MRPLALPLALCLSASPLAALAQEEAAEEIVVTGSQVTLPGAYEGGQVARGGRAGLLGNLDFMDAPYASLAYTEALIRAQQAKSVGDVLANDPAVRVAKGFGNFQELYVVRGFPVYSDDMTLNGVYGVLPRQYLAAEIVERVEVFRGANAFLNGATPGGSGVGGAFNIVPKRAGEEPLTRLTLGLEGQGHVFGAADIGSRFGSDDQYGVRLNLARRSGETAIDGQDRDLSVVALGVDRAGERVRFSADLGYQDHFIDAPRPQVTPGAGLPPVPEADTNYAQPWTFTDEKQLFGVARVEVDATEAVTLWAAAGGRRGEEANSLANPTAGEDGTGTAYRFDNTREDDVLSADIGARADFALGGTTHRAILSAATTSSDSKNAYAFSDFAGFGVDLIAFEPAVRPAADFFIGGDLGDPGKTEEAEVTSIALADVITLADGRLIATLGVRHQTIETASFDYNTGDELSRYDDSAVTPALGLVFKPSEMISLYANYAESLQPGAVAPQTFGEGPVLNAGEALEPYRGEQVEAGVKVDREVIGGTLSVFTLAQPSGIVVDQRFTDGGERRHTGAELSVFGEPAEGFRILGGVTWLDASLEDTQDGLNEGNRPVGTPELQGNLNVEWDVPALPGLILDARLGYTGEQYTDQANTAEIDAWTRTDIGVRYTTQVAARDVTLRLRADNVTDEAYWASTGGFPGANYLVQGAPRTVTFSVSTDL